MEFLASLETLSPIMDYIRGEAIAQNVPSATLQKIELAAEEAVVNIIMHAYDEHPGPIDISCTKNKTRFEITLSDTGIEFNPIDVDIDPQFNTPVQERRVGGLGIYLIRKTIDEVIYQREEQRNVLRLVFNT